MQLGLSALITMLASRVYLSAGLRGDETHGRNQASSARKQEANVIP